MYDSNESPDPPTLPSPLSSSLFPSLPSTPHSYGLSGDTSNATVELDRRMLDFCVGLDTEFSEIVEGSHLYYPKTKFDQVDRQAGSTLCPCKCVLGTGG